MLISEIAAKIERRAVTLPGGRVVSIRALTDAEASHVERVIPRPVPPLTKDPTKGSLAEPVVNPQDPGHQAEVREWLHKTQCAQVAIAADLQTKDGKKYGDVRMDPGETQAFFMQCRLELGVALTRFDLMRLWNELHRIAEGIVEEAEGNSSGPSPATGTGMGVPVVNGISHGGT